MPTASLLLTISVLGLALPNQAQQAASKDIPTFTLDIGTDSPLLVPNFAASGSAQCDASKNAYFGITSSEYPNKYILRISADGQETKPFQLPSNLGTNGAWIFYVDSAGTIYGLFSSYGDTAETQTLIEISSSGEELRRTQLQLPGNFDPSDFAVLPTGRAMVSGRLLLPVQSTKNGESLRVPAILYTAWLDPNGKVIRDSGSRPTGKKIINVAEYMGDRAITAGPPGTFLTVSGSTLNTYDSSGLLSHSSPIIKPEKDAFADSIQYVDGQAEIDFYVTRDYNAAHEEDSPHPPAPDPSPKGIGKVTKGFRDVWLIADPATGTLHGFFKLPESFRGRGVCYLGNQDFLYITMKDMKPSFVEAHPK